MASFQTVRVDLTPKVNSLYGLQPCVARVRSRKLREKKKIKKRKRTSLAQGMKVVGVGGWFSSHLCSRHQIITSNLGALQSGALADPRVAVYLTLHATVHDTLRRTVVPAGACALREPTRPVSTPLRCPRLLDCQQFPVSMESILAVLHLPSVV